MICIKKRTDMHGEASGGRRRRRPRGVNVALLILLPAVVVIAKIFAEGVGNECKISLGDYKGPSYVADDTIKTVCLVENKWMRLMKHSVSLGGKVIDDWLFIDYHDRINVLVEDPDGLRDDNQRRFFVFRQQKYAYEGESYAIVGGIIEPGEDSMAAAKREVLEEMDLRCNRLILLGRYRTDVNRGMGWVHSYVAMDCVASNDEQTAFKNDNEVGAADSEMQDRLSMTLEELRERVQNGMFIEVQWSNTVAQALLSPEMYSHRRQ